MEQPGVAAGNFALSFSPNFLSIFMHISGAIRAITLIWTSLEGLSNGPIQFEGALKIWALLELLTKIR